MELSAQKGGSKKSMAEQFTELFAFVVQEEDPEDFVRLMGFLGREHRFAPYNAYLLYLQCPTGLHFLRMHQISEFGRRLRDDARPLVILRSFGPVEFVFDLNDTEPIDPDSEDSLGLLLHQQPASVDTVRWYVHLLDELHRIGIAVTDSDMSLFGSGEGTDFEGSSATALAIRNEDGQRSIALRSGALANENIKNEVIGDIVHEAAHHLLGHLGSLALQSAPRGGGQTKFYPVTDSRRWLTESQMEFEAEIVAFLVMSHLGCSRRTEHYLRIWKERDSIEKVDIWILLTTANKIIRMNFLK